MDNSPQSTQSSTEFFNGFMDEEKETSVLLRVLCGGKLNQKIL